MSLDTRSDEFGAALKPWWLRAQAGDEDAYRHSLALIAARLRGYLHRRLSAFPDEVEDLLQETLLALHLHRGTYVPALPVSAWVISIARYKWVDHWRRHGRRDALHDPIDDIEEHLLVADESPSGARRDLEKLLDELPPAQQRAIVLTGVARPRTHPAPGSRLCGGRVRGLAGCFRVCAVLPGALRGLRGGVVLAWHRRHGASGRGARAACAALVRSGCEGPPAPRRSVGAGRRRAAPDTGRIPGR
jgi:RNA polymerase sigma factor (sigma-70 family)